MSSIIFRRIASRSWLLTLLLSVIVVSVSAPLPLLAQGTQVTPQPRDLGPTNASQIVTASLVLKVRHPDLLEAYVASTQDPNSPSYHRFLSLPSFVFTFAPTSADIFILTQYLESLGIQVTDVYADHLLIKATGTVDAFNKAFSFAVHDFSQAGRRFHRPLGKACIPSILSEILVAVVGPSDEARFHPMNVRLTDRTKSPSLLQGHVLSPLGAIATGVPGEYTVGDVANFYDINPLYNANIDGRGRTVGIATLANFLPSDAYAYWKLIGLKVLPDRITQVHVDGGGELSGPAGSGETSLDVEQSGGLAPYAKIIVYDAPNTNPGFIDLFYKAASDNLVDSLSVSWGEAEIFYFFNNAALAAEDEPGQLLAFHQAFLELAAQGISAFASAGDNGAYDANSSFNESYGVELNNVLTVDSPGSDPAITTAGGTTRPFKLPPVQLDEFQLNIPLTAPPLVVTTEQVWGWDYLQNYLVEYGGPIYQNSQFPGGGGGGVSIFWPLPHYQSHTPGMRRTEPGQSVVSDGQDLLNLPANFPGRNLPDVSLNADPLSGYLLLSTEDGGLSDFWGGTSFVGPQLNGITALISQATGGGRIGLWNPMFYRFQQVYGYGGASPFRDITKGDNWFYYGIPGYEPGAGLGVLDVAKLAAAVARDSQPGYPPRNSAP
jgi:kumamolisin